MSDPIPRRLHYCWFGGPQADPLLERCAASWERHLGDFEVMRWDESNVTLDSPYARAALEAGHWSRLANWVRLWALAAWGGVYLDTDVEVLRPLTPLLVHEAFAGFQLREPDGWDDWVNTAVLGARAGHPFLAACRRLLDEEYVASGHFLLAPRAATRALRACGLERYGRQNVGGVEIFPIEWFYPFDWIGGYDAAALRPETLCIHHWKGSWLRGTPPP